MTGPGVWLELVISRIQVGPIDQCGYATKKGVDMTPPDFWKGFEDV
jgi:hypothetical protein